MFGLPINTDLLTMHGLTLDRTNMYLLLTVSDSFSALLRAQIYKVHVPLACAELTKILVTMCTISVY